MRSLLVTVVVVLATSGAARAAGVVWDVRSSADSTVAPGGSLTFWVWTTNVGDVSSNENGGTALAVELPAGMTFVSAAPLADPEWDCSGASVGATSFSCTHAPAIEPSPVGPRQFPALGVTVKADPDPVVSGGLRSVRFTLEGGGAAVAASTVDPTMVTSDPLAFGLDGFDQQVSDAAGNAYTQAGGHPASITTEIDLNRGVDPVYGPLWPAEPVKDVVVDTPPGVVGNPTAAGQCTAGQLAHSDNFEALPLCPTSSQLGVATVLINRGHFLGWDQRFGPVSVYNMVPPPGAPARFGFNIDGSVVTLDARLRSGSDYGVSIDAKDNPEALAIVGTELTLWGVPADPSHNPLRGCPGKDYPAFPSGKTCPTEAEPRPFLRNPTSCAAPAGSPVSDGLVTSVHVDSWMHPGASLADGSPDLSDPNWKSDEIVSHEGQGYPANPEDPSTPWGAHTLPTGCENVPFSPSIAAAPNGPAVAGAPAAYRFDVSLPQNEAPSAIGESDLRTAEVTLPEGVELSPSSADGLGACGEDQVGLHSSADASCPDSAKLGTATVVTPLLKDPLLGAVYLATPYENPSKSLLALYIVVSGPGFEVKLAGEIHADPSTGRLTTTFKENPQLPFSDLRLQFKEGPRAALANPSACGSYTTVAHMLGWNGKEVETKSHPFAVSADGHGAACASSFAPSFTAGTPSPLAGRFSPFGLSFSRSDPEQQFSGLSDTFPAGASAVLKGVAECSAAQVKAAEEGTGGCPEASRIGSVTVGSGAGPDPFFLKGSVYLTGPYNNGPFGAAVVVPAVAGPFDLGNVVVRNSIRIDPHTAQPTVVSDPFPRFVKDTGIPTDIRRVDVSLDRAGFTFNPTNCSELHATGTLTGSGGASVKVASRFQVANCASLAFKPSFKATVAKNSTFSGKGAGFTVKIATHGGPGQKEGEANIAKVNVRLPKILPSRLETLQKACTEKVFAANPAACPAESKVGTAMVTTPLLASPLSGPAILVSHGGAGFPDLVLVLQGEGITIELTGKTEIKGGYTFSRFNSVPDAPVSSFQLNLPRGRYSALAANGNMCKKRKQLKMPTTIIGQNGAVIKETTKIAVPHCAKAKKHSRKHKKNRKSARHHKKG